MRRRAPSLSACTKAISAFKRRIAARTSSNHNEEEILSALLRGSKPVAKKVLSSVAPKADANGQAQQDGSASRGALVAAIIIARAPAPPHPPPERPRPGLRLRPRGEDPAGKRRRLGAARLPQGRGRRAIALALHQRGGDTGVHGRPAGGCRARRHT